MALPPELIEIVACPRCKGKLELAGDASAFLCRSCKLAYAVEDDIPNFLIEDARPLGAE
jgi:uncharacterized protein YbaR (Trm112 family)